MDLLHLCGIDDLPKRMIRPRWVTAQLKFLGGDRYVLGTKSVEVKLRTRGGGFGITFRKDIGFKAESLLGKSIDTGTLVDIMVVFPDDTVMPSLSLASLSPGRYPLVLRRGQVVRINA